MLIVAIHSNAPPYLAVTAGPASHSPPPMAEAPITRPGPIIARMFFQVKIGASMSSSMSQRGMALVPGCGASKTLAEAEVAGEAAVAVIARQSREGGRERRSQE